ncbi:hypothetical protein Tco_0997792, partial [Tanacetum coccineum]
WEVWSTNGRSTTGVVRDVVVPCLKELRIKDCPSLNIPYQVLHANEPQSLSLFSAVKLSKVGLNFKPNQDADYFQLAMNFESCILE